MDGYASAGLGAPQSALEWVASLTVTDALKLLYQSPQDLPGDSRSTLLGALRLAWNGRTIAAAWEVHTEATGEPAPTVVVVPSARAGGYLARAWLAAGSVVCEAGGATPAAARIDVLWRMFARLHRGQADAGVNGALVKFKRTPAEVVSEVAQRVKISLSFNPNSKAVASVRCFDRHGRLREFSACHHEPDAAADLAAASAVRTILAEGPGKPYGGVFCFRDWFTEVRAAADDTLREYLQAMGLPSSWEEIRLYEPEGAPGPVVLWGEIDAWGLRVSATVEGETRWEASEALTEALIHRLYDVVVDLEGRDPILVEADSVEAATELAPTPQQHLSFAGFDLPQAPVADETLHVITIDNPGTMLREDAIAVKPRLGGGWVVELAIIEPAPSGDPSGDLGFMCGCSMPAVVIELQVHPDVGLVGANARREVVYVADTLDNDDVADLRRGDGCYETVRRAREAAEALWRARMENGQPLPAQNPLNMLFTSGALQEIVIAANCVATGTLLDAGYPLIFVNHEAACIGAASTKRWLSTTPVGHHGLDLQAYAQFTSPLRRHDNRLNLESLSAALDGQPPVHSPDALMEAAARGTDKANEERPLAEAPEVACHGLMLASGTS